MKNKVKCIELRTNEGKVILSLYLCEKEISSEDDLEALASGKTDVKKAESQKGSSKNDDLMTDAQKRYLFRILAGNGLEADEAHEKLKELFQVDSLKDVTKVEASNVIEKLLEESKGEKDDRTPF